MPNIRERPRLRGAGGSGEKVRAALRRAEVSEFGFSVRHPPRPGHIDIYQRFCGVKRAGAVTRPTPTAQADVAPAGRTECTADPNFAIRILEQN